MGALRGLIRTGMFEARRNSSSRSIPSRCIRARTALRRSFAARGFFRREYRSGEQRRLRERNIFCLLRKIEVRRLFDAVDSPEALLPEVDLVEVHLQDLFLRVS